MTRFAQTGIVAGSMLPLSAGTPEGADLVLDFGTPFDVGPNGLNSLMSKTSFVDKATAKFGSQSWLGDNTDSTAFCILDKTKVALLDKDFTIEFFIKAAVNPSYGTIMGAWGPVGYRNWQVVYDYGYLRFNYSTNGSNSFTAQYVFSSDPMSTSTFWNGNWHHVAIVRNSGVVTVYVDGVAGAGTNAIGTGTISDISTMPISVGGTASSGYTPANCISAYLDEARLTLNYARYTTTFSPPTVQFGRNGTDDPNWSDVAFLYDFENRYGVTRGGSVTASLFLPPYGYLDGACDLFGIRTRTSYTTPYIDYDTKFNFGSSDFTIETTVHAVGSNWDSNRHLIGCWSNTGTNKSWRIATYGGYFVFQYSTNGSTIADTVNIMTMGVMDVSYNITVCRSGSNLYCFVDGVLKTTYSIGSAVLYDTSIATIPLGLLCGVNIGGGGGTNGCIGSIHRLKSVRTTKGVCRWTADYTVPDPVPLT